jgi:hypothetical protein
VLGWASNFKVLNLVTYNVFWVGRGRFKLETMPLNISWKKFQEKITNALASSFLYGSRYLVADQ